MLRAASFLAVLFLASVVPSHGQMRRAEPQSAEREVKVSLGEPLTVECTLRPEQKADWQLNGKEVPKDMKAVELPAKDAMTARLSTAAAKAQHAGVYTCSKTSPRIRVRIPDAEPAETTVTSVAVEEFNGDILYFDLRHTIVLNCSSLVSPGVTITWKKNGTLIENLPELKGHIITQPAQGVEGAILTNTGRSTELDTGNYTCSNGASELSWQLRARPIARLPSPDTNVVEGQKLKLNCKILGRPVPPVQWTYSNTSEEVVNGTDVRVALGERVKLSSSAEGVIDGELVIEPAERTDAGWYKCTPVAEPAANATSYVTRLRVKDMYAALWPFLGICAEVFILCAIILVYEKRRTKPELDDSDTDNHDQKKS